MFNWADLVVVVRWDEWQKWCWKTCVHWTIFLNGLETFLNGKTTLLFSDESKRKKNCFCSFWLGARFWKKRANGSDTPMFAQFQVGCLVSGSCEEQEFVHFPCSDTRLHHRGTNSVGSKFGVSIYLPTPLKPWPPRPPRPRRLSPPRSRTICDQIQLRSWPLLPGIVLS